MVEFPLAVKNIASEDANFEYMITNSIQSCLLARHMNIVTSSRAIIFVNTHLNGQEYAGASERTVHY